MRMNHNGLIKVNDFVYKMLGLSDPNSSWGDGNVGVLR